MVGDSGAQRIFYSWVPKIFDDRQGVQPTGWSLGITRWVDLILFASSRFDAPVLAGFYGFCPRGPAPSPTLATAHKGHQARVGVW